MASTSNSETASTTAEENRIRLCEEFATIAETDIAVARCYLANNEWEVEVMDAYVLNLGSLLKVYFGKFRTIGGMYGIPLYCMFINIPRYEMCGCCLINQLSFHRKLSTHSLRLKWKRCLK